jgi:predicted dehydrogenase
MKEIKTGIIGCGHLGKMHIKNVLELEKSFNGVKLSGIFDIDQSATEILSSEFGIKAYSTLDSLLDNINTCFIVTPTTTHYEIASKTISRKIHTFIEKPLAETIEEAEALERLKPEGVIVQVGHIERFNPAILALKDFTIKPVFIETHRLSQFNPRGTDVSVIKDLMIHDIDIILNFVNSEIKDIQASGVGVLTDNIDIANARLAFENGCVANVTASRISLKKMRKMRIFQKNAYISIDFLNNVSEVFRLTESSDTNVFSMPVNFNGKEYKLVYDKPNIEMNNAMRIEEELFFRSILENKNPQVSLKEGKLALIIANEIITKIESNKHTGF